MKVLDAWQIVAAQAHRAGETPEENLALNEALHTLAVCLDLAPQAASLQRLIQARRIVDRAQLDFNKLLSSDPTRPSSDGPDGTLPPHGPHGETDPS